MLNLKVSRYQIDFEVLNLRVFKYMYAEYIYTCVYT